MGILEESGTHGPLGSLQGSGSIRYWTDDPGSPRTFGNLEELKSGH